MSSTVCQLQTEVIANQQVLLEAAATVGMSPNAVESLDVVLANIPKARLRWPSFFCTQADYVRVLAYLLQNDLPFDLEVSALDGGSGRYQLHPPLDAHTAQLLASIDPGRASIVAETQSRVERVFEQLRKSAPVDGTSP